jgi:hypothetical protein
MDRSRYVFGVGRRLVRILAETSAILTAEDVAVLSASRNIWVSYLDLVIHATFQILSESSFIITPPSAFWIMKYYAIIDL